jgi:uncharacterized lipoprotein YddW (UPF0748 family)
VDGVHIDDYFYPYRERDSSGAELDFPDSASWARYVRAGGRLARDDWRRRNVDEFVRQLYAGVRATKRSVKVGVSPFGIWRPGYPESVRGLDAYQEIYADSRRWLENGWLDYLAPQLYWPAAAPEQGYAALLRWWVEHNAKHRHIWPGNFTSRVGAPDGRGADARPPWAAGEILEQIRLTRVESGAGGNIHFSMKALMENRGGLADSLAAGPYAEPALVPPSPMGRPPAPLRACAATRWPAAIPWRWRRPRRGSRRGCGWYGRASPTDGPPPSSPGGSARTPSPPATRLPRRASSPSPPSTAPASRVRLPS